MQSIPNTNGDKADVRLQKGAIENVPDDQK